MRRRPAQRVRVRRRLARREGAHGAAGGRKPQTAQEWCDAVISDVFDSLECLYLDERAPGRAEEGAEGGGARRSALITVETSLCNFDEEEEEEEGAGAQAPRAADVTTLVFNPSIKFDNQALKALGERIKGHQELLQRTGAVMHDADTIKAALSYLCTQCMHSGGGPNSKALELVYESNRFKLHVRRPKRETTHCDARELHAGGAAKRARAREGGAPFTRMRHEFYYKLALKALEFKHVRPGTYVLASGFVFEEAVKPKHRGQLLGRASVTRAMNQTPAAVRVTGDTTRLKPFRAETRLPAREHLADEFDMVGMEVDLRELYTGNREMFSKSPVSELQEARFRALGIPGGPRQRRLHIYPEEGVVGPGETLQRLVQPRVSAPVHADDGSGPASLRAFLAKRPRA